MAEHDSGTVGDIVPSLIRTWVPVGVGAAVSWLVTLGVELDDQTTTALVVAGTGLCTGIYYTVVRLAETRWPNLGALLGTRTQPAYDGGQDVVEESEDYEAENLPEASEYPEDSAETMSDAESAADHVNPEEQTDAADHH